MLTRQRGAALLILMLSALGGCTSFSESGRESPAPIALDALRRALVFDALGQIGRPYRYGGQDPEGGFDCSGLVRYLYGLQGVALPRTTREQQHAGSRIRLDQALPGDLLFYSFGRRGIDHVALYLGDGQAIHAPSTGRHVIVAPGGNRWWQQRYVEARRVLPIR